MALQPGSMPPTSNQRPRLGPNGNWKRLVTPLSCVCAAFLILIGMIPQAEASPHNPQKLTWQVISQTGDVIWSATRTAPPWTWWPQLSPKICSLLAGCVGQKIRTLPVYVCPQQNSTEKCGGAESYYCKQWGCETTGDVYWGPSSSWDLITVKKDPSEINVGGRYVRFNITFTRAGKNSRTWLKGNTWGLRFYMDGPDKGVLFSIRLKIKNPGPILVGPNAILQQPPVVLKPKPHDPPPPPPDSPKAPQPPVTTPPPQQVPLLTMIQKAFALLNATHPEMTDHCWLCYDVAPPYYEAIALPFKGTSDITTDVGTYQIAPGRLTLTSVSGQGLCLGQVPPSQIHLCNSTYSPDSYIGYIKPPLDVGWWACGTGLTSIVSLYILNNSKDYCILVQLLPRLIYHPDSDFLDAMQGQTRAKREPVSLTLAVLLGIGTTAGIRTGIAALTTQDSKIAELQGAIAQDICALEDSISKLQESLTSLSEVALQNRRGLDLLFLQQGGLCTALKEECCFYVDHSRVIKDSMKKLRERLDARNWEKKQSQGWFKSWFNSSPWMTTLISTLLGPILILLLLLTFGPCILNRLVSFIRERISTVQLLVLRQKYQQVEMSETEIP